MLFQCQIWCHPACFSEILDHNRLSILDYADICNFRTFAIFAAVAIPTTRQFLNTVD